MAIIKIEQMTRLSISLGGPSHPLEEKAGNDRDRSDY